MLACAGIARVAGDAGVEVRLADDLADLHAGAEVAAKRVEVDHRVGRVDAALEEGAQRLGRIDREVAVGEDGRHIAVDRAPFERHRLAGVVGGRPSCAAARTRRRQPPATAATRPATPRSRPTMGAAPDSNAQHVSQRFLTSNNRAAAPQLPWLRLCPKNSARSSSAARRGGDLAGRHRLPHGPQSWPRFRVAWAKPWARPSSIRLSSQRTCWSGPPPCPRAGGLRLLPVGFDGLPEFRQAVAGEARRSYAPAATSPDRPAP